jgi:DNA-binding transcriptional ArsR family regulator
MVRQMPKHGAAVADPTDPLDGVFNALADPTRRAVVERLSHGPASTSDLARPFAMALPSFTQHMAVLERCGLVASHKRGRIRTYRLTGAHLTTAEGWLGAQRSLWERRLDQLDEFLITTKENHHP